MAVPVLFCACAEGDSAETAAAPAAEMTSQAAASPVQVVEVGAMDYSFEAPAVLDAGWTTFRLANHGAEAHHLTLVKLDEGHTIDDVIAAVRENRPLEGIGSWAGGPNAPMPGADANATVDLTPGEYALICLVPSPDGVPHLFKGMVKPLTVRQGTSTAQPPEADLQISLRDYAFLVEGQITSGERTIRAVNQTTAGEPHEIVLVRLSPGSTAEDVNRWVHSMQGPPPAEFLGGMSPIGAGQNASFTMDFTPGEYALLCLLPSADGHLHSNKGMMLQFTVS